MGPNDGLAAVAADAKLDALYERLKEVDTMEAALESMISERVAQREQLYRDHNFDVSSGDAEFSLAWVYEQDEKWPSMKQEIEDLRSATRAAINAHTRPKLRSLSILDMPDEILAHIFEYVRGNWKSKSVLLFRGFHTKVSNVKNLRLTCRRFCHASSHLLIHSVRVDMSAASLSLLESISRHPTIRKGVRAVRVCMDFYHFTFANDLSEFVQRNVEGLLEIIDRVELEASWNTPAVPAELAMVESKREEGLEATKKMRAMMEAWEALVDGTPDDLTRQDDLSYRMLLRKAHQEYQRRFAEQESLLKDGALIQVIAAAIARMPLARALEFSDDNFWRRKDYVRRPHDDEAFAENMLIPLRWDEARLYDLGQPPAEVIVKLPGAIHRAGGVITSLKLEVSPPEDYTILEPSENDRRDLKGAMQKLKIFEFSPTSHRRANFWPAREPAEWEALGIFLNTILDTDSIQVMSLDFTYLLDSERPGLFSLGSIISPRPWSMLHDLHWASIPLHLAELEQFMDPLDMQDRDFTIYYPHLLSGSWADGLETLRRKSFGVFSLKDPFGAECENLSDEEKRSVFARRFGNAHYSWADRYVLGHSNRNPMRNMEGGFSNTE